MRDLPKRLVFVDIETTGEHWNDCRVLEVGVIRVEDLQVVDQFSTLLNPTGFVAPMTTRITGITNADIEGKPVFRDIAERLSGILDDAVFVAHNVGFDYTIIRQEFTQIDMSFAPERLCTVQLSRSLFAQFRHHNLQALIDRHSLQVPERHRAMSDALALWQFYQVILAEFEPEQIIEAIAAQQKPIVPKHRSTTSIPHL